MDKYGSNRLAELKHFLETLQYELGSSSLEKRASLQNDIEMVKTQIADLEKKPRED
jgi:hypothetical protein